jgi:HK97 family phage portal protein
LLKNNITMGLFDYFRKKSIFEKTPETKQNTLESTSTRKAIDDFFSQEIGFMSNNDLLQKGYLKNDNVYSIINKIAKTTSNLPIGLYKNDVEVFEGDEVYDFIIKKWNKNYGIKGGLRESLMYYLALGDTFLLKPIQSVGFSTNELTVLPTDRVTVFKRISNSFIDEVEYYEFADNSQIVRYLPEEIIHIKMPNPYNYDYGLSPLNSVRNTLEANNNLNLAEKSIFENGGATKSVSPKPNANDDFGLTPNQKNEMDEAFKQRRGGAKGFNKVITTTIPIEVSNFGMTSQELQLIQTAESHLRRFCNVYGVDTSLFNDTKTQSLNNKKEAEKALYNDVCIPLAETYIEQFENHLIPKEDGYYMKIKKNEIDALKVDPMNMRKQLLEEFSKGVLTLEEYKNELSKI